VARQNFKGEVLSHAIIVGALALAASGLEWLRDSQLATDHPVAYRAGFTVIAVVIAFGIMYLFASMLERSQLRQEERLRSRTIRLKGVESIDGVYIDAVYQANGTKWTLEGGLILEIRSTISEGYHVHGDFFDWPALDSKGYWDGDGAVIGAAHRGFVYRYGGGEGLQPHSGGIGYYEFHREAHTERHVTFTGEFFASNLTAVRRVRGRMVSDGPLKLDVAQLMLRSFLEHCPTEEDLVKGSVAMRPTPISGWRRRFYFNRRAAQ
jgi:hypothetical protein